MQIEIQKSHYPSFLYIPTKKFNLALQNLSAPAFYVLCYLFSHDEIDQIEFVPEQLEKLFPKFSIQELESIIMELTKEQYIDKGQLLTF